MQTIIKESFSKSHNYSDYRAIVSLLLKEGKSSGNEQSEALTHYSELNETRMHRLDKTIKISQEIQQKLQNLKKDYIWLLISEGWCGDAAQIIPAIQKIAALGRDWKFSIALRDENPIWMNLFLTNGAKAIPIAVVFDAMGHYIFHWGPRPKLAIELINNAKSMLVSAEVWKVELHKWYATNKQQALELEWMELLTKYKTT